MLIFLGEAWHLWKAGYNISEAIKNVTQLDPEHDVFIMGSAYSNNQGWTEGAFESANDLLTTKFSQRDLLSNVLRRRLPIRP